MLRPGGAFETTATAAAAASNFGINRRGTARNIRAVAHIYVFGAIIGIPEWISGADAMPDIPSKLTVVPDVAGVLHTTVIVGGLTFNVGYQFEVEACNATGCSPFSGASANACPLLTATNLTAAISS